MSSSDNANETSGPWDANAQARFETKRSGEYFDPCEEAAQRSLRCLHRNGGDREMCADYFQAYRDCKKQWIQQRKQDRQKAGKSWFG